MKIRCIALLLLAWFITGGLFCQEVTGDIESYINDYIDNLPGSNGNHYAVPGGAELLAWQELMEHLLNDDLAEARQKADSVNYRIVEFEDVSTQPHSHYYVVEEKSERQKFWGTYVFNRSPMRPQLVIQSPHPIFDLYTGKQGFFCYKRLGALAFFISGAHRCNNTASSPCSGTTSACGSLAPYRISDNPHNVESVYQKATEVLYDERSNTYFVQLHGFAKQETDPYVIMSNGTRITPDPDYISALSDELHRIDNSLTFKIAHIDLSWSRLIAFTNVQGRYINKSVSPCYQNAVQCTGRFIHIEQERSKLRENSILWLKMYEALAITFAEQPVSDRGQHPAPGAAVSIYPNPSQGRLVLKAPAPFEISVYNAAGICIARSRSTAAMAELNLDSQLPGIYIVRIVNREGTSVKKIVLK